MNSRSPPLIEKLGAVKHTILNVTLRFAYLFNTEGTEGT